MHGVFLFLYINIMMNGVHLRRVVINLTTK